MDKSNQCGTPIKEKPLSIVSKTTGFHGENIAEVMAFIKKLLHLKASVGHKLDLTKQEMQAVLDYVYAKEFPQIHDGVNFSRIQIDKILEQQMADVPIEFETIGPYLASYMQFEGIMTEKNLLPEDRIGIKLATVFRKFFPHARLISLYDDYNHNIVYKNSSTIVRMNFSKAVIKKFLVSFKKLLVRNNAISQKAIEGKDFLFIPESELVKDAEKLVATLEAKGFIERKENEIFFHNPEAENQLFRRFQLKTKNGKWLCEALDASTFIKPENVIITHVVVLPEYMKPQQDKLWEILKVLGIKPEKYHNIFFDESRSPESIATIIEDEFKCVREKLSQNN